MTSRLRVLSVVLLCVAALSSPAMANRPSIVDLGSGGPFVLPSDVTGCAFNVLVTPLTSDGQFKTFFDQDGNVRLSTITGAFRYEFTNMNTGRSQVFNSSAAGKMTLETGDVFHAKVTGSSVLILAPGAVPNFPQFALTKGQLDMIITLDFITLQINSFNGTVQDICSVLR